MRGELKESKPLIGVLVKGKKLMGSMNSKGTLIGSCEKADSSIERYDGAYEVTPSKDEEILETKNKKLINDITVHAVPYSEVSNISGGYTVTIL